MLGILIDEVHSHAVELFHRHDAAFSLEPTLEHLAGAGADHVPPGLEGNRAQAFAIKYEIERADEVGCGFDECAVEIEDDGGFWGHGHALSISSRPCKPDVLDSGRRVLPRSRPPWTRSGHLEPSLRPSLGPSLEPGDAELIKKVPDRSRLRLFPVPKRG